MSDNIRTVLCNTDENLYFSDNIKEFPNYQEPFIPLEDTSVFGYQIPPKNKLCSNT